MLKLKPKTHQWVFLANDEDVNDDDITDGVDSGEADVVSDENSTAAILEEIRYLQGKLDEAEKELKRAKKKLARLVAEKRGNGDAEEGEADVEEQGEWAGSVLVSVG